MGCNVIESKNSGRFKYTRISIKMIFNDSVIKKVHASSNDVHAGTHIKRQIIISINCLQTENESHIFCLQDTQKVTTKKPINILILTNVTREDW